MAALESILASAPLWVIGLIFLLALIAASMLGRWVRGKIDQEKGDSDSAGYLLSAALALLGLLIAFTFSLAVSRYDSRRIMIVDEGNAISTAWLRSTLVDGAEGEALRAAIKAYADIRLRLPDAKDHNAIEAASAEAQGVVWQRLRATLPNLQPPIATTLITGATEMFDAAASRKAERNARIPGRVLDVVSLFAIISAAIVGYVLGRTEDRRHWVVTTVVFLLLTLAMLLILDLDRPWSGGITLDPQPIIDARAAMN
jgi:uncharacterized membrane protein YoaK (UPF0700 family)